MHALRMDRSASLCVGKAVDGKHFSLLIGWTGEHDARRDSAQEG
jgi:hypothetical protein